MGYKRLFIFVEGNDDKRFFNRIIKPIFEKKYDWVEVIQYAQDSPKWRVDFLKSIQSANADYIYVADINNKPCVSAKKQAIQNELKDIDENSIIIVKMEIESWYLAGVDDTNAKKLKICTYITTDTLTKEQFNCLTSGSRINFMSEILNCFSLEGAKQKNNSFKYFMEKYNVR